MRASPSLPVPRELSEERVRPIDVLLRYAAARFDAAGQSFPPGRLARALRRMMRARAATMSSARAVQACRQSIDAYFDITADPSWMTFERFTATGYADPTGAEAAFRVDHGEAQRLVISAAPVLHAVGGARSVPPPRS